MARIRPIKVRSAVTERDFDRARAKLRNMERKPARRVLTKSIRSGGGPLLKASRKGIPVQTKTLKRSLRQRVRFYRNTGTALAVIGTTKGKDSRTGRTPSNYLHLVENPTRPHDITVSGRFASRRGRGTPGALTIPVDPLVERTGNLLPLELTFVQKVHHPGTKGKGFLKSASITARNSATARFKAKFVPEVIAEAKRA